MQDLVNWLSDVSRTYAEGLNLYHRYGNNRTLMRFFSLGENVTSREQLYFELRQLARSKSLKVPLPVQVKVYRNEPPRVQASPMGEQLPEPKQVSKPEQPMSLVDVPELDELLTKKAYCFRQKEILRKSLFDFAHSNGAEVVEARRQVMSSIVEFKKEISQIATKIAFYEKNGYLPLEEDKTTKDYLIKQRNNLRSNVSRQKKLIKNATSVAEKLKAEKRLATYQKELDDVEKKLNEALS